MTLTGTRRRILTCGDLRFARFKPDPHENEKNLDAAYEFVNLTKLVAEPVVEGAKV